jgi:hypothetical protein
MVFETSATLNKTIEEGNKATEKMNELADNLLLARNVLIYSMAFYASWTLLKKYLVKPFMSTYRFLSNQT